MLLRFGQSCLQDEVGINYHQPVSVQIPYCRIKAETYRIASTTGASEGSGCYREPRRPTRIGVMSHTQLRPRTRMATHGIILCRH